MRTSDTVVTPSYCDTSAGRFLPYIAAPLRLQVFQSVHDLSHPGTKTTAKLVVQRFVWPDVQKDCRTWARVYQSCQHIKVTRHTSHSIRRLYTAGSPFYTRPHSHRGTPSDVSTLRILPHCSRSFHPLAASRPHIGHHSRHRGPRLADRLDVPLRLSADYHHRPGTSV
jgi:hypothetical protein